MCMSFGRGAGLDTLGFIAAMQGNASLCANEPGAYVAAQSHAPPAAHDARGCTHNATQDFTCKGAGYGSEPLCCGQGCTVPSCTQALWPGRTRVLLHAGPCAALPGDGDAFDGVLCCRVEPHNEMHSEMYSEMQAEEVPRRPASAEDAIPEAETEGGDQGEAKDELPDWGIFNGRRGDGEEAPWGK